jgi:hypothetical protein
MSNDEQKPKGPFPHPAKNMNGDRSTDETDGPRNPARAPGHRPLDRKDEAAAKDTGKDASGPAPDSEPQQSRELRREQH